MAQPSKECVAGFGHTHSLWLHFTSSQMVAYTIETPGGSEKFSPDIWFEQHMLILTASKSQLQKSSDVFPYLTQVAGTRAVQAIRDYSVYELALAFTSHFGWQLINGAKVLPDYGELAKVYAGNRAVYLFKTSTQKETALRILDPVAA